MRPQRLAVAEQKVEGAVGGDPGCQLAQRQRQFGHAGHPGMGLGQLLHDPAKRAFTVGTAHGPEVAMQARRKVDQVAVVGKHPVAAPQLAHKRMAVLQGHAALRGLADVCNHVAAFDRVAADQLGHRRRTGRLVVDKVAQALVVSAAVRGVVVGIAVAISAAGTFKKRDAPAIGVVAGGAAALGKTAKTEGRVGRCVAVHA